MKKCLIIFILISIFSFNACDLLRFSRFEVISWTPREGYHDAPERISVSIEFSNKPDKGSAERNFSLTGNGNRVRGNFTWHDSKMFFTPATPLEENTDYIINISADTRDENGLSMDSAFIRNFTTRPANVRPSLISCSPSAYSQIDDLNTKVTLEFSIPVPLKTLYDNVSFNPSMAGIWRAENEGKTAVFTPLQSWTNNSRYEIRISVSLTDNNGMNIGNDFLGIFTTGTDCEKSCLLSAWRITKDSEKIQLFPGNAYFGSLISSFENTGWEKDDRLSLVFSKPVDVNSVKNFITIEDGPNIVTETPPGFYSEIYYRFENIPAFESRFTIKIKPGIKDISGNETKEEYLFKVFADGKFSKPPALAGIRMPMAPDSDSDMKLKSYGADSLFDIIPISDVNYPSGESVRTWIELYFSAAEGAAVDLFSVMELFRVETSNNVITFSPRHVKTDNFTVTEPKTGWENYQRIEIAGNLINSTFYGIINIQITAGLTDSLGNKNEKLQGISLIK